MTHTLTWRKRAALILALVLAATGLTTAPALAAPVVSDQPSIVAPLYWSDVQIPAKPTDLTQGAVKMGNWGSVLCVPRNWGYNAQNWAVWVQDMSNNVILVQPGGCGHGIKQVYSQPYGSGGLYCTNTSTGQTGFWGWNVWVWLWNDTTYSCTYAYSWV